MTLYKLEDILNGNLDEVIDALVAAETANGRVEFAYDGERQLSAIDTGTADDACAYDATGNRISIASSETVPQDLTGIAINVDNFQEAYDFFIGKGFIDPRGGKVTDTSSSRATLLFAPSGFAVNISEHIKDQE